MRSIKFHRVVLTREAFQRMTNAPFHKAIERAENEGWPIPAEAPPATVDRSCRIVFPRRVLPGPA